MKKYLLSTFLITLLILVVTGCGDSSKSTETENNGSKGSDESNKVDNITIGTAGEGGAFFYIGAGIADVINKNTAIKATSQATGGGTENARRINTGDMDIGFAVPGDIRLTLEDKTLNPLKVKVLTSGHSSNIQIVVREDSDIKTIDELFQKGRRIGIGEPGSAIQLSAQALLSVHGLTMDDIKAAPLSQAEQSTALQNGTIDGALLGGSVPVAAVSELANSVGIRILPVSDELLEKLQTQLPEMIHIEIPAGTYKDIDEPILVYGTTVALLVRADLPEETIYEIIKTIHEHAEDIAKVHPSGSEFTLENAFRGADYYIKELGLEFHPGAIKWYKENGIWTGEYK